VDPEEAAGCDSGANRALAQADLSQLVEPHDAVLPFGDRGDAEIDGHVPAAMSSFRAHRSVLSMMSRVDARVVRPV